MEKCKNSKCGKAIAYFYSCKSCSLNFCSTSCLKVHSTGCLSSNKKSQLIQSAPLSINNSNYKSVFMKPGILVPNQSDDPFYDLKNFDIVKKNGKKYMIGEGAFAQVYLIKHKQDSKFYALKQMDKMKLMGGGINPDMIYREIMIQKKLDHDNIIKLYSSKEDDNNFYLILEYAVGGSLYAKIKKMKNGMEEDKAFQYFIQASSAIAFLHEHQLVHRDIKPENFLIDSNGIVRLCDFGWCRDLKEGNRNTFCGTYEYMAPEIVKEQPYSYGIDTWALGVLLYELIHGYSPFRAQGNDNEELEEIMKNIVKYKFQIDKKVTNELKDLIQSNRLLLKYIELLTPDHEKRLTASQIFSHPWVQEYEKKYFMEIKAKKDEEDRLNQLKSKESLKNLQSKALEPSERMNNEIDLNKKMVKRGILNDFSILTSDLDETLGINNKIVVSTKINEEKLIAQLNNPEINTTVIGMKDLITRSSVKVQNDNKSVIINKALNTNSLDDTQIHNHTQVVTKNMRYVNYYDQSFADEMESETPEMKMEETLQDISVLKAINQEEDVNQSLFDDVLNQVFLKNDLKVGSKKKKKKDNQNNNTTLIAQNNINSKQKKEENMNKPNDQPIKLSASEPENSTNFNTNLLETKEIIESEANKAQAIHQKEILEELQPTIESKEIIPEKVNEDQIITQQTTASKVNKVEVPNIDLLACEKEPVTMKAAEVKQDRNETLIANLTDKRKISTKASQEIINQTRSRPPEPSHIKVVKVDHSKPKNKSNSKVDKKQSSTIQVKAQAIAKKQGEPIKNVVEDNPDDYFDEKFTENLKKNMKGAPDKAPAQSTAEEDLYRIQQLGQRKQGKAIDINFDKYGKLDHMTKEKLKYEFENETKELISNAGNQKMKSHFDFDFNQENRKTTIKDVNRE